MRREKREVVREGSGEGREVERVGRDWRGLGKVAERGGEMWRDGRVLRGRLIGTKSPTKLHNNQPK